MSFRVSYRCGNDLQICYISLEVKLKTISDELYYLCVSTHFFLFFSNVTILACTNKSFESGNNLKYS